MLNSAVVLRNELGNIVGVVVFDNDEYSHMDALKYITSDFKSDFIADGCRIDFVPVDFHREDDEIANYIMKVDTSFEDSDMGYVVICV